MIQSTINVEHVRVTADKPFEKFTVALEQQLGHFDPVAYEDLKSGGDPQAVRARLESMTGPSGFMLFNTNNHGLLLRLVERPAQGNAICRRQPAVRH